LSQRFYLSRLVSEPGLNRYDQSILAKHFRSSLDGVSGSERIAQMVDFVYSQSSIQFRYSEIDLSSASEREDWYAAQNAATWQLSCRVLERLFGDQRSPTHCDALIVVSSSYNGFPALSRRLQDRFVFPLEAYCLDLTGGGCGGPTQGLAVAQSLLESGSARSVCIVCVDTMGTFSHLRRHRSVPSMEQVVAHCLASDGAAALILSSAPDASDHFSYRHCRLRTRLWPHTLDQNAYSADADNQPYLSVGTAIRHKVADELALMLDESSRHEPMFIHPGGVAVMKRLLVNYPDLREPIERAIAMIVRHGNVGSPSVLWVLRDALESGCQVTPRCHLVALAPGIVSTHLVFSDTSIN